MNEIKTDTTIKMTDISIATILSEHNKSIARLNSDIENTQSQVVQALEVIKDTQKMALKLIECYLISLKKQIKV